MADRNQITLGEIKAPLESEMSAYEHFLREALHSDTPYFDDILKYIFDTRGKGVRPILVMLFAGMHNKAPKFGGRIHLAASLIELIHTASLVHDDVIDRADIRHGKSSVNQKWGKRNAILTGDFILSRIFEMGMESLEFDILTYVSHTIKWLCEGEVIQDEQTHTLGMTHEKYYDIIDKKTASLLAISCGVGALAAGASTADVDKAYEFGRNIGMAFQIKDDILDYAAADQTGKPTCADLREHKITLPLLEAMAGMDAEEESRVRALVGKTTTEEGAIEELSQIVATRNGMAKAEEIMNSYLREAHALLSTYPESPYRHSLELMCDFLAQRKH
ncbi:MAG: polyprenyl synthetase family protein [Tidjanibacter sp.]|nr:polyprenyl synthetase family protein [Tidjanibacter sp.]